MVTALWLRKAAGGVNFLDKEGAAFSSDAIFAWWDKPLKIQGFLLCSEKWRHLNG